MKHFTGQVLSGFMVAVLLSITPTVYAASYPNRDISFIVPFGPGGGSDPISRQFARQLGQILKCNVNVENRPGGAASIGIGMILKAKPDGYTIGHATGSGLTLQPLLNPDLSYKTPDDNQPIVKQANVPSTLAVRADAPWKTFKEFLADAKKNPGKIRVAVSGMQSNQDLMVQLINMVTGTKLVSVPFSGGGGEALISLMGGRVEAACTVAIGAIGHAKAGSIRVLAVLGKERYKPFPDIIPSAQLGYDVHIDTLYCVIGPKGMPKDVQDKLFSASMKVIQSEEYNIFADKLNYIVDKTTTPEKLKAEIVELYNVYGKVFKYMSQK